MTTVLLYITSRQPTAGDAFSGYVLAHNGRRYDPQPTPWREVKPGQPWCHCPGWVDSLPPLTEP